MFKKPFSKLASVNSTDTAISGITLAVAGMLSTPFALANTTTKRPATPPFACFASQMNDRLADQPRYEKSLWNLHDTLKLPDWLSVSLEQCTRYELLDGQFRAHAQGGDQQIPLETCLSVEASFDAFRFGVEFLDSRQFGSDSGSPINNTHANEADFLQVYLAFAQRNFLDSGIGTEVILGRQTLNFGSRRLVARNVFRNTINAFTGARLRFQDNGKWQFNGFVTMPVGRYPNDRQELLDGKHEWDKKLYKTWFSGGFLEIYDTGWKTNAELYLYHLSEGDQNDNATRNRRLFTPGMRWYRKAARGSFDFQLETGWTHLFKGAFARDAPNAPDGQDVDYFYVQSLFRF